MLPAEVANILEPRSATMFSSSTVLFVLGISTIQVLAGIAVGWWLRATRSPTAPAQHETVTKKLTEALARLHTLGSGLHRQTSSHTEELTCVQRSIEAASKGDVRDLHTVMSAGMSQIMAANERLLKQLNEVETKLDEQGRQIEVQLAEARIDCLTGVANRRAFDEEMTRRLAEWRRRHVPMSLLLIDVDNFKKINDRFGHPTGDYILRELARVLQNTMREMDFTSRYGGEEFSIVLPGTTLRDARSAAQRALKAVAGHHFEHNGHPIPVTISVGLAEVMPSDDAASLTRRADEALYLSKAAGRNCGYFHSGTDFLSLESPMSLEGATRIEPMLVDGADPDEVPAEAFEEIAETISRESMTATPGATKLVDPDCDLLTGLPAAPAFAADLRRRVYQARNEDKPLTLVLIDIDHLGKINRREGREEGDRVVRRLADILRNTARDCDSLARYHEGQFALTLYSVGTNEALRTVERVRRALQAAAFEPNDAPIEATISCGLAEAGPGDRSVALVMRATSALTAAKSSGRDCVFVHDGRTVEPIDETALS